MVNMICMIHVLFSIGTLLAQIILLRELIEWRNYFEDQGINEQESEKLKTESTHSEIPEWVEKFIDDYISNSEKDNRQ